MQTIAVKFKKHSQFRIPMRLLGKSSTFHEERAEWERRFDSIKGSGFSAALIAKRQVEFSESRDDLLRVNAMTNMAAVWIMEEEIGNLTCDEVDAFFGNTPAPASSSPAANHSAPKTSAEAIRTYYALNEAGRTKEAAEFYARHRTLIFGNRSA